MGAQQQLDTAEPRLGETSRESGGEIGGEQGGDRGGGGGGGGGSTADGALRRGGWGAGGDAKGAVHVHRMEDKTIEGLPAARQYLS